MKWRSPHDGDAGLHLGKQNALLAAIGLSVLAFGLQVVGAWYTGSLALFGDSAHLLTDLFSLVMSLAALKLTRRPATEVKSFGLFRLEVLATFVNGLLLLAVSVGLLIECASRFWNPHPVKAVPLMVVAGIGLLFNLLSGWLLHRATHGGGAEIAHHHHHHHHHGRSHGAEAPPEHGHGCAHHDHGHGPAEEKLHLDRNLHSALLHIWSDALNSVAVIAGALVVHFTGLFWVDAAVAAVIALWILRWSLRVIQDSGHVLLEGTPRHVAAAKVLEGMRTLDPRVARVEDLHVWEITSRMYAATAEVWVRGMDLAEAEALRCRMHDLLRDRYGIAHVVLAMRPV